MNEPKKWRGHEDGLPPVDTVCEYECSPNNWAWCRIKYRGDKFTILETRRSERSRRTAKLRFRPLTTEEDRAVDEMLKIMDAVAQAKMVVHEKQARALYRAGYRKQESE